MARIIVALSGGVDSAVAALTLKEAGWDPIGVHLRLFDSDPESLLEGVCCGDQAAADARMVAATLGIPFYVRDLREMFTHEVADATVDSYSRAETPNPCIVCNAKVRIPSLLRLADSLGIEKVATGHYVGKTQVGDQWFLTEGQDPRRDQSYALFRLRPDEVARLEFPLSEMSKSDARERARAAGLLVADKASSVDLCFAKTAGGVGKLVASQRPETGQPGRLRDESGREVGHHRGIAFVTIGQRSGLQWSKTTPERRYVSHIDPATREVTVAPRAHLDTRAVRLRDAIWHGDRPTNAEARLRYQGPRFLVRVDGELVTFLESGPPLAAGQSVVLYDGDRIVGGGVASEIERATPMVKPGHLAGAGVSASGPGGAA